MNRLAAVTLAAFIFSPAFSRALEPWANTNLSVTHDLDLWFDASVENAARASLKLPLLNPGADLDFWHDGSGNARHASQRVKDSRPHLRRSAGTFFVRFD